MTAFTGDHFAFLTRFLAQSRDAVLAVTVDDGAIIWANDRAEQLLGQLYASTIQESCRVSLASLTTLLDNPGKKTFVDITIGSNHNTGHRSVSLQGVGERMPGGDNRAALLRMEPGVEAPAATDDDAPDFERLFNSIDAGVTLRDPETFAILHQNPRALQWIESFPNPKSAEHIVQALAGYFNAEKVDVPRLLRSALEKDGRICLVHQCPSPPAGR